MVAALLGAGEVQVLAQGVEQRGARVEAEGVVLAVDVEGDALGAGLCVANGVDDFSRGAGREAGCRSRTQGGRGLKEAPAREFDLSCIFRRCCCGPFFLFLTRW